MNTIDDGGPAFPLHTPTWHEDVNERGAYEGRDFTMGMSMRDYFAAKAMAAMICEPQWGATATGLVWKFCSDNLPLDEAYATSAYVLADSMLKARLTRG